MPKPKKERPEGSDDPGTICKVTVYGETDSSFWYPVIVVRHSSKSYWYRPQRQIGSPSYRVAYEAAVKLAQQIGVKCDAGRPK